MNSVIDTIIINAMRDSRDNAMRAAIEMAEHVASTGGCADCCVRELKELQARMKLGDTADEMLSRVLGHG